MGAEVHKTSGTDTCLVCGGTGALREVKGFGALPRITSDCRPFPPGGYLTVCRACGAVQKRVDERWLREIQEIYSGYSAYYQAGGEEQIVFDRKSGQPRRRSVVLTEHLGAERSWPTNAEVLDVGCGNGATLAAMSEAFPAWKLDGFELGDGALPRLQKIDGFRLLHTGALSDIGQRFDLVSMVHAIEHFPDPIATLRALRPVVGRGCLFIEVCNVEENPFDILVADHLLHFSPHALARLLRRAGFSPARIATDWVAKEISLLAEALDSVRGEASAVTPPAEPGDVVLARIERYVAWLVALVEQARVGVREASSLGIFGTSIAATWLAGQLGERLSFFVDEDPSRIGRSHLGRKVFAPEDVPNGSTVLVALAPAVAEAIVQRLSTPRATWMLPPA